MKEVLQFAGGRLSPAVAEDLAGLLELLHDKEVRRYLCDDSLLPREAVAEMLTQSAQLDSRGLGLWMIELPDGSTAGVAGLQPVSAELEPEPILAGGIEPVIALYPAYWGQGLAKTAMDTLIDYARNQLRLSQLVAVVDEPNTRSHLLMENTGFVPVARTKGPANELILYRLRLRVDLV